MVRDFDPDRAVDPAALDAVLDAARRTPSAGFSQGTTFLLLEDPADVAAYWQAATPAEAGDTDWLVRMRRAPVLLLVWADETAYRDRYAEPDKGRPRDAQWPAPWWWVDSGMASMAVLYAVVAHGLGACFFGVPPQQVPAVRERFAVPERLQSAGVVAIGHPARGEKPGGSAAKRARRDTVDQVRRGRWTP